MRKVIKTYCEITWAMAAPLTPNPSTKMNIGSNMMFVKSPITASKEQHSFNPKTLG